MAFLWTDELTTYAASLYRAGKSSSEIARALVEQTGLRLTRNSVIGRLYRIGLIGRTSPAGRPHRSRQSKPPKPRIGRIYTPVATARVRAPIVNPRKPVDREAVVGDPLNVPLLELQAFQCRAVTDDTRFAQRFCGHMRVEGRAWCAAHTAAFVAVSEQGRAA